MKTVHIVLLALVVAIGFLTRAPTSFTPARNLVPNEKDAPGTASPSGIKLSSMSSVLQQGNRTRRSPSHSDTRRLLFVDLWEWIAALIRRILGISNTEPNDNSGTSSNSDRSFAINKNVIKFSCSDSETDVINKGTAAVTISSTKVYIGTRQVSSNNQNPIVAAFDGSGNQLWCREDYETTGADGRGLALLSQSGKLYAAFTSDGTQGSASEDFRRFTSGGWLPSYGAGGGPKVSILLEIDSSTGNGLIGTFLRAKLSNGNTNSLLIKDIYLSEDSTQILVQAQSWYLPLDTKGQRMTEDECGTSSPFDYTVTLSDDLSTATDAVCFLKSI